MNWKDEVKRELRMAVVAQEEGNDGRARTCARRAAGFALSERDRRVPGRRPGTDFLRMLRALMEDPSVPTRVREAARRLQAKLGEDFRSEAVHPVEDASTIASFVAQELGESLTSSSPAS